MSNFFGGNRYKQKNLILLKKFYKRFKTCSKTIKKTHLKIAIENHQDLSSKNY